MTDGPLLRVGVIGAGLAGEVHMRPAAFDVEDFAAAHIRTAENLTLTLETSWATYRTNEDTFWITIYGTRGGAELRIADLGPGQLQIFRDVGDVAFDTTAVVSAGGAHESVVRNFVEAVLGPEQQWSEHDGRTGLRRTEIVDAIYGSAANQREVLATDSDFDKVVATRSSLGSADGAGTAVPPVGSKP